MLPIFFRPLNIDKKKFLRLGQMEDGGYLIHKGSIKLTEKLITLGLNDDWSFEKDFLKFNKQIKVYAYDHTITNFFWFKRFFKDCFHLTIFKKLRLKKILDIFKYLDYFLFFSKHKHYKQKIGNKKNSVSLNSIFQKPHKNFSVFLKIDIEGSEYEILGQISKFEKKINSIIIEFHNINKKRNLEKIKNFILKNKFFKLIHIHGNNFSPLDRNSDPTCVELTFVNKNIISVSKKYSNFIYPLNKLDYPNNKRVKDIKISFDRK